MVRSTFNEDVDAVGIMSEYIDRTAVEYPDYAIGILRIHKVFIENYLTLAQLQIELSVNDIEVLLDEFIQQRQKLQSKY